MNNLEVSASGALITLDKNKIVGAFELIDIPSLKLSKVLAKIDTGAYYGAIHVDDLALIEDGSAVFSIDGVRVSLTPEQVKKTRVRSSSGHQSARIVARLNLIMRDNQYLTWIGLTDRSEMKFPVLIGRYFLRENNLLVDVNKNSHHETDGRRKP